MIKKVTAMFSRDGLKARALRGALASVMMSGGEHILRFASNLILTRLLFPEAFGLMALLQVFLVGVQAVTNFGLRAAVLQNPRGDEPAFLNTAWTLQIIRGILIWLILVAASPLIADLYDQPILAQLMPVAALTLVITGFRTTKVLFVQRHLQLGRFSALEIVAQAIGLVCMSLMAWQMGSVWALVLGTLVQPVVANILHLLFLDGSRNRLQLERESVRDILTLGKFLVISTIATYVIKQSDRAVLGLFIPIDLLGIYGIAFALASVPVLLADKFSNNVVFPLYRMRHPLDAPDNRRNIFRARRMTCAFALGLICFLGLVAPWLMDLLYDDRYSLAGPIAVLMCMANVPVVVLNGTMNAALSKGDSYRFMLMNLATAFCQGILIFVAVRHLGVIGAPLAIGTAQLLTYPVLVNFLRRYNNWDRLGDSLLMLAGFSMTGLAVWIHWDRILLLTG